MQKSPCHECPNLKTPKNHEPCASCPLPIQYDDALKQEFFPSMAFLRESRPDHWGIQTAKEKREMAKQENNLYYKNCDQCGEKKRADTYFEKAGNSEDGYRNTCSKCIRDNRMKKEEEHVRAKAAADALSKKPFTSENKEPPEKKTGKFTVSVDLPKYCAQEGISVEKVTSDSKMPVIADARKRIARAMVADGIDRKLVALKLKIGASTLWNYLQEDNPESDKPKKPEVIKKDKPVITLDFTDREDLYEEICNIAEERLRKPAGQVLWWLMNADFDKLIGGMAGE